MFRRDAVGVQAQRVRSGAPQQVARMGMEPREERREFAILEVEAHRDRRGSASTSVSGSSGGSARWNASARSLKLRYALKLAAAGEKRSSSPASIRSKAVAT